MPWPYSMSPPTDPVVPADTRTLAAWSGRSATRAGNQLQGGSPMPLAPRVSYQETARPDGRGARRGADRRRRDHTGPVADAQGDAYALVEGSRAREDAAA